MSYVIDFFKTIFIFVALLIALSIPGYLLSIIGKQIKIRSIFSILVLGGVASFIYFTTPNLPLIYAGVFLTLSFIAILVFKIQLNNMNTEYTKIKVVAQNIDTAFAVLYAAFFSVIFVYKPELMPFEINKLSWYMYVIFAIGILTPPTMLKSDKDDVETIKSLVERKQIVSPIDIVSMAENYTDNPSEDDLAKKIDDLYQMVEFFAGNENWLKIKFDIGYLYVKKSVVNIAIETLRNMQDNQVVINSYNFLDEISKKLNLDKDDANFMLYLDYSKTNDLILIDDIFIKNTVYNEIKLELKKHHNYKQKLDYDDFTRRFNVQANIVDIIANDLGLDFDYNADNVRTIKNQQEPSYEEEQHETSSDSESEASLDNDNKIIDLNTASESELALIAGIGVIAAKKAIMHRNSNSSFSSVDEFIQIAGIKPHNIENVKNRLTCSFIKDKKPPKQNVGRIIEF